ncbi:Peptidylprolyl isomerase [Bertholletia excelsa]
MWTGVREEDEFTALLLIARLLFSPSPPCWCGRRFAISLSAISTVFFSTSACCWSKPEFFELQNSGGVKALDIRFGQGDFPLDGDIVAIHYYGRLAAKQGWRFDSTYDHKDETGEPIPFTFILGSGKVIPGIEAAVQTMKVGGMRRVIIPPSQGYQNTFQEPIPLIFLIGKGCLQPFSIQHVLPTEKDQRWGLSYLILNWSA